MQRHWQRVLDHVDHDRHVGGHAGPQAALGVVAVELDDGCVDLAIAGHPAAIAVGYGRDAGDAAGEGLALECLGADEGRLAAGDLVDLGFLHLDHAAHLGGVRQADQFLSFTHLHTFAHGFAATAIAVDAGVDFADVLPAVSYAATL